MSDKPGIARRLLAWASRGNRPELILAVFIALNLLGMVQLHAWLAPIPFHFIYTAVTILYGLRLWKTRGVVIAAVAVAGSTGALTLYNVVRENEPFAELVEVPLMISMFLATAYHVRSRQKAAAQVVAAAERERAFFANVSHDLMTPLTVARGHLDLLGRTGPADAEEVAEAKRIVVEELKRIESMVGDLLIVGRLDDASLEPVPTDAHELLDTVIGRWTGISDRVWSVDIIAAGSLLCDGNTLAQALDNVIENAVSYTGPGDAISVVARGLRTGLQIVVEDSGPGIPPETLPHVFDRFYRGDRGRSRATGGSGLGLAIVRDVVHAHGGEVTAESTPGAGTRIVIELPGFTPAPRRATVRRTA